MGHRGAGGCTAARGVRRQRVRGTGGDRRRPLSPGSTRQAGHADDQGQQPSHRRRPRAGGGGHLQHPQLRPVHGAGRHEELRQGAQRLRRGDAVQQLRRDAREDPPTRRVVRPRVPGPERPQQDGLRRAAPTAQPLVPAAPRRTSGRSSRTPGTTRVRDTRSRTRSTARRDVPRRPGDQRSRERIRPPLGQGVRRQDLPARRSPGSHRHVAAAQRHHRRHQHLERRLRPEGDRQPDRADRPREDQDRRQCVLRGPGGHGHGPPVLVGRSHRRAVLPAEGGDARRARVLAPPRPPTT